MAKLTWLGEDSDHQREDGSGMGPSFIVGFGNHRFDKGKPTTITDWTFINKAIGSRFFEVELTAAEQERYDDEHMPEPADEAPEPKRRAPGRPPKVKPHVDDQDAA
jgi:hypothetical protein